jgi:hypothetical protein
VVASVVGQVPQVLTERVTSSPLGQVERMCAWRNVNRRQENNRSATLNEGDVQLDLKRVAPAGGLKRECVVDKRGNVLGGGDFKKVEVEGATRCHVRIVDKM